MCATSSSRSRDRLVVALVEEVPVFKPMYRDERVDMGLYRSDTAAAVSVELRAAAPMFIRLFEAIDPSQLTRELMHGVPDPTRRSLLWIGQQVVHEVEHHGGDIAENLRLVGCETGPPSSADSWRR